MLRPRKRFQPYHETTSTIPESVWWIARITALLLTVGVIVYMLVDEPRGLRLFWQVLLPSLPLLFAVAPGLWRQICPMATLNQWPVVRGWSLGRTLPTAVADNVYLVALLLFVAFIVLRRPLIQDHAVVSAALLALGLVAALLGGYVFKGRSGWCGTFCPLGPIQKLYGHAPTVVVRNGYCPTCIGCQSNCYDFNPTAALHADINDLDEHHASHRMLLAAALPGLICGFWLADPFGIGGTAVYFGLMALYVLVSIGIFFAARALLPVRPFYLATVFGMTALVLFYWFEALPMLGALSGVLDLAPPPIWASYVLIALVAVVALRELADGFADERAFQRAKTTQWQPLIQVDQTARAQGRIAAQVHSLRERSSGRAFSVKDGSTLLETLESGGVSVPYGCRTGVCGADPVAIVGGADSLSPMTEAERATLVRLGAGGDVRLACVCRIRGSAEIDLAVLREQRTMSASAQARVATDADPLRAAGIGRIVIVGNGVAGTTCADLLRQASASCEIDLITRENHHFYNRMALGRVLHERSALGGLTLLHEDWYAERRIRVWLNTLAVGIDPAARTVRLGVGDVLHYDRLILATGAAARKPEVPGHHLPGVFVLREAEDALRLRTWRQTSAARQAVVVGGGPLGVEAAASLLRLGLRVALVHRGERILEQHLDADGAGIVQRFLHGLGITFYLGRTLETIEGVDRVSHVKLDDGDRLATELCLFCTGVGPNVELATAAGVTCDARGIVVDEAMRTSVSGILAVGDAVHRPAHRPALWTTALDDAQRAVTGMTGGGLAAPDVKPDVMQLKVSGIEVGAFGSPEVPSGARVVGGLDEDGRMYRKVVIAQGRIIGAQLVGAPGTCRLLPAVTASAVDPGLLRALDAGDWLAVERAAALV